MSMDHTRCVLQTQQLDHAFMPIIVQQSPPSGLRYLTFQTMVLSAYPNSLALTGLSYPVLISQLTVIFVSNVLGTPDRCGGNFPET